MTRPTDIIQGDRAAKTRHPQVGPAGGAAQPIGLRGRLSPAKPQSATRSLTGGAAAGAARERTHGRNAKIVPFPYIPPAVVVP